MADVAAESTIKQESTPAMEVAESTKVAAKVDGAPEVKHEYKPISLDSSEDEGDDKDSKSKVSKELNGVKKESQTPEKSNGVKQEDRSPELEKKLLRQIEYYFGDINLPRDKFLQEQIKLDDGWIQMSTMLNFKRLAQMSTDVPYILDVLKRTSTLMEVDEEGNKIRRKADITVPELTEERRLEVQSRTVYCKGIPKEGLSLDDLMDFFKDFGTFDSVHMRSYLCKLEKRHVFKGSVFCTFTTKELAEKFLALPEVKIQDAVLEKKWQSEYHQDKRNEYAQKKLERKQKDSERKQALKKVTGESSSDEKSDDDSSSEEEERQFPKGAILHITDLSSKTSREDIKAKLSHHNVPIAFVDFKMGDTEGWLRMEKENDAHELQKKIEADESKLVICEAEVKTRVLEGEEEEAFFEKTRSDIKKIRERNQASKRGKRGRGGRGGRGFRGHRGGGRDDRKRRGEPSTDGPPAKK